MKQSNCETCAHYLEDEVSDLMFCEANLDEDEMRRFYLAQTAHCPYYEFYDEYKIVQKQN